LKNEKIGTNRKRERERENESVILFKKYVDSSTLNSNMEVLPGQVWKR
jgi:hypothetical protein